MTTNIPFAKPTNQNQLSMSSERLNSCWKQFTAEFPTEDACVNELYRRVYQHHIRCSECNSEKIKKLCNSRIIICRNCNRKTYTLAGTFFHNIRGAQHWLGAIWFMEQGHEVNASAFARLAKVVSSTAQNIFKKLCFVIMSKMSDLPETPSREFLNIFRRRSRLTPAGESPASEQSDIEKSAKATEEIESDIEAIGNRQCSALEIEEPDWSAYFDAEGDIVHTERSAYEALKAETLHFDMLWEMTGKNTGKLSAALFLLELKGLVKQEHVSWYCRSKPANCTAAGSASMPKSQTSLAVKSFIDYVSSTFNGISRKYLQNYLAWHWCVCDRKRWSRGTLLSECAGFGKTTQKEILYYVSPLIVKLAPLPTL